MRFLHSVYSRIMAFLPQRSKGSPPTESTELSPMTPGLRETPTHRDEQHSQPRTPGQGLGNQ